MSAGLSSEAFRDLVEGLSDVQHEEILLICKKHAIKVKQNKNNALVDVSQISAECRKEIDDYVEFSTAALGIPR